MERIELLAKRVAFQERRRERAGRRVLLDQDTRTTRDLLFRDLFLDIYASPTATQLQDLTALLDAGATTAAFDDNELGGDGNFARGVDHWLEPYPKYHPARPITAPALEETLACFGIAIEAGDAFITNRAYVGNGGARTIYWLLDWLFQLDPVQEGPKSAAVERLFEMILIAAPEEGLFWGDLQADMWRTFQWKGNSVCIYTPLQQRVARQVASLLTNPLHTIPPDQPWDKHFFAEQLYPPLRVLTSVLSAPELDWLIPDLLEELEAREGMWSALDLTSVPIAFWEQLLDAFLRSPATRRYLVKLLALSPRFLEALVGQPVIVFRLVKQRERRLLRCLLWHAHDELLAMRNEEGQNLLLYACTCRGRIERIIELLYDQGFALDALDAAGQDALALALQLGDKKVIKMVRALGEERPVCPGILDEHAQVGEDSD